MGLGTGQRAHTVIPLGFSSAENWNHWMSTLLVSPLITSRLTQVRNTVSPTLTLISSAAQAVSEVLSMEVITSFRLAGPKTKKEQRICENGQKDKARQELKFLFPGIGVSLFKNS